MIGFGGQKKHNPDEQKTEEEKEDEQIPHNISLENNLKAFEIARLQVAPLIHFINN